MCVKGAGSEWRMEGAGTVVEERWSSCRIELREMDGKGRSGREVGKEWVRDGEGRGRAAEASGEDTRGRVATGLNGEGTAAATVMTAGGG